MTTSVNVKTLLGQAYPNVTLFAELELEDGVQLWANGPYFAKANVGATEPEGSGYYFWWGDTVGYEQVGGKWVSVKDGSAFTFESGNCSTHNKSIAQLCSNGYIDANSTAGKLWPNYDAARAHLGGSWRLPTSAELVMLISNCTREWTVQNGVNGCLVTGKGTYSSKSIFLPAASDPSTGVYWSSAPSSDLDPQLAMNVVFNSIGQCFLSRSNRWQGFSVRAVRDAK